MTIPAARRRTSCLDAALLTCSLLTLVGVGGTAIAGGYDTPMLYSARHMGMGGTAIPNVEDPSALFHNPAGLGHVRKFVALGDFSLLLARIKGSPGSEALDIKSEQTVAPLFLLGAAHRINDWLVAGLGVYPIASAGATYKYPFLDFTFEDTTRLVFIEASPGLAVNLLNDRLRLGVGYRLTYVSLERYQGDRTLPQPGTDFKLTGLDAKGFRLGAQYTIVEGIAVGAVYRHKTKTHVANDNGRAVGFQFHDVSTEFVLASKLGGGVHADVGHFGLGLDLEYLFNSQNAGYPLVGTPDATDTNPNPAPLEVSNVFEWKNEFTLRTGVEYRLDTPTAVDDKARVALRLGYVFDGKTANPVYPSAFGTPPGPTHVLTAGAGLRICRWDVNVAYARRFGHGAVTATDVTTPGRRTCQFCGAAGKEDYEISVNGLYVDLSFKLD
jgi:long-subunit fatty acid transport protein